MTHKKIFVYLSLILLITHVEPITAYETIKIDMYGRGCSKCINEYYGELLSTFHQKDTYHISIYFPQTDIEANNRLSNIRTRYHVPKEFEQLITIIIDDKYLFEGEIEVDIIKDFILNHREKYDHIVIAENELWRSYKYLDANNLVIDCQMGSNIFECIEAEPQSMASILYLTMVTGFLDGVNPCAFSVLLFFVALIFSAKTMNVEKAEKEVMLVGGVYIVAVFLSYLLIGLLLFNVVRLYQDLHLIARLGAALIILIGLFNIKDAVMPGLGPSIRMPSVGWERVRVYMRKLTIPATFISGLLVGFFEFPCTGGLYFGIISLLASRATITQGFIYLILYNLFFILPLIIVLLFTVHGRLLDFSLQSWRAHGDRFIRLLSGLFYIVIGALILFYGLI